MVIVGICGKLGSGKDFIASNYIIPYLEKRLGKKCLQLSFADQLKINTMTKGNNIKFEDVYIKKTDKTRELLQKEGTELGRNKYGEDIWIHYFANWMKVFETRGFTHFICSDVRFLNEVKYIRDNKGILIKVIAETRNEIKLHQESKGDSELYNKLNNHSSECNLDVLDDSKYDLIINNDTTVVLDEKSIFNQLENLQF